MDIITFFILLAVFLYIGYRANARRTYSTTDYLTTNRSISPLLVALSAAASKYSGYMFIGLVGYIYTKGLAAVWILLGFLIGDFVAFYTCHRAVREATERTNTNTFIHLLSRWQGTDYTKLRRLLGIICLVFLLIYTAAQLSAGSKTLQAAFAWQASIGALIGAAMIVLYCYKGGLRASVWTDAAQAVVMLMALTILLWAILGQHDGYRGFINTLHTVSPNYMSISGHFSSLYAVVGFAMGWLFNGLGVVGQPHIMVRFMSLDKSQHMMRTGIYYFLWSALFLLLILGVSLGAKISLSTLGADTEQALPILSQQLLPAIASGILIGGIFAAIISTSDSLILSCSATLSEDFNLHKRGLKPYMATVLIVVVALIISLFAPANVFTLVVFAWSALASSMGPLVFVYVLGKKPSEKVAIAMALSGLTTALLWRAFGLSGAIYEALPGILMGLCVFAIGQQLTQKSA